MVFVRFGGREQSTFFFSGTGPEVRHGYVPVTNVDSRYERPLMLLFLLTETKIRSK